LPNMTLGFIMIDLVMGTRFPSLTQNLKAHNPIKWIRLHGLVQTHKQNTRLKQKLQRSNKDFWLNISITWKTWLKTQTKSDVKDQTTSNQRHIEHVKLLQKDVLNGIKYVKYFLNQSKLFKPKLKSS